MRFGTGLVVLIAALAGGLFAAQSATAGFIAETRDPQGDSSSTHPGHDLLGAGIGFDQKTGYMVGAFALRGRPDHENAAFITLYAGTRTPEGCSGYPSAGFGAFTDSFSGYWVRQFGPDSHKLGEADKTGYMSDLQTFEVRTREFRGKKWNCLGANLSDPDDPSVIYDRISPVAFRGLPALKLRMPRVRKAVKVNRTRKLRVVVGNPGDGPLRGVKVQIRSDRGLKLSRHRVPIRLIRPGRQKAITVRVKPTPKAGTRGDVRVIVRGGKMKAEKSTTIRVKHPPKKPKRGGGGGGGGSPSPGGGTCVQYFPDLSGETGGSLGLMPC